MTNPAQVREIVESYLRLHLNRDLAKQYLKDFDGYLEKHQSKEGADQSARRKKATLGSVKILSICNEIGGLLHEKEKLYVVVRLLEFIRFDFGFSESKLEFVSTVAEVFNISRAEFSDLKAFILHPNGNALVSSHLLTVSGNENGSTESSQKHIGRSHLQGTIRILQVESSNTFILQYDGTDALELNTQPLVANRIYVFDHGAVVKGPRTEPLYYTDVATYFIDRDTGVKVILNAREIEYKFPRSENGIQRFSFSEQSGHLVGIMGGSGVGKSTFLNVLNGKLPLIHGSITINGYDLHKDSDKLEGLIGYVPQDDLLIDELTVFENLFYSTSLCFGNASKEELTEAVEKILFDLDLVATRDLKVGNPLNKTISGGQRKRLNIALELIREPSILIVDEPTSGLSSQDSEMVMGLLKEQTLYGKLVIVNIHQPSSDIYKLFDTMLMFDKGGYPVYYGNPVEAITYFKLAGEKINAEESECVECGNIIPEQPLQILEAKIVNENGRFTKIRKISPKEWYKLYREKIDDKLSLPPIDEKLDLPKSKLKLPGLFRQFTVFAARNIRSKIANTQYLLINILEAPLLAVILAYFIRYADGTLNDPNAYLFSKNDNIPAYLFMCVLVALFIGMTVSAEEIIRDRRILQRESFLNLSWFSYLNAKIFTLFGFAVIQAGLFTIIGNLILGISGMTLSYFIIMFTTISAAILIGLNLSAILNSVVTIYISIPLILVPQILLSGVMVDYGKINKNFASVEYVPIIGDMMVSRWAYEAFAVNAFKNNAYQKVFFEVDKELSHASFQSIYRLPELESKLDLCMKDLHTNNMGNWYDKDLDLIKTEFTRLEAESGIRFTEANKLDRAGFTAQIGEESKQYTDSLARHYRTIRKTLSKEKTDIFNQLAEKQGSPELVAQLSNNHHNQRLTDVVQREGEVKKIAVGEGNYLFQLKDPIYNTATNNFGRSHYYASEKTFLGIKVDTVWFNIGVVWMATTFLYLLLVFDIVNRIVNSVKAGIK